MATPPVRGCSDAEFMNPKYRPSMEDVHTIFVNFLVPGGDALFAVYDGHGGREMSEYSSRVLPEVFGQKLKACPNDVLKCFRYAYLLTDIESASKCSGQSGCTAVSVYLREENGVRRLYSANVGDARSVLSRGGRAVRLSYVGVAATSRSPQDHKATDSEERLRIERLGGFIRMSRVIGMLAVSRSLGDHSLKAYVSSEPFLSEHTLDADCDFLILACDGLWDVMSDQEVVDFVRGAAGRFASVASELIQEAIRRGSQDNISVIVIAL